MREPCNDNCKDCASDCAERRAPQSFLEKPHEGSHIKKVIGVISGKGGVGKSLITSLLASEMNRKGKSVAVLDADITGPSIPRMFGVQDKAFGTKQGIIPLPTAEGIKIMSINLLLQDESDPVVWRGPIIGNAVKQFWTDVVWGDIDVMFVDMPPGTGDVALTVFQSLPVDGIVIVTSPQELVGMIVGKAVKMANMLDIPILGLVENMAYFECPSCGEKHRIFGESHIENLARQYGIVNLAQIPMDTRIAAACDSGKVESVEASWLDPITSKL